MGTNIASVAWDTGSSRHDYVRGRLENLDDDLVFISAVSLAEVEYGLLVSPAIDANRQSAVRNAMSSYTVLQIDQHTSQVYAKIRANLFKKYSPIKSRGRLSRKYIEDLVDRTTGKQLGVQENDLWIISVAVQYNLIFVTSDQMHRVTEEAGYANRTEFWN